MPIEMSTTPVQDPQSFLLWFYKEYSRYIYKLALQTCYNPSDVDDLVQEVWLRLCVKCELLSQLPKERHLSYIASAVRNTAISIARKQKKEYPLECTYAISYNEVDALNTIFDRQIRNQRFREIWTLVPPATREILERKYTLFETDEEIAFDLCIKPASVRMYLTRARKTACAILIQHKNDLV